LRHDHRRFQFPIFLFQCFICFPPPPVVFLTALPPPHLNPLFSPRLSYFLQMHCCVFVTVPFLLSLGADSRSCGPLFTLFYGALLDYSFPPTLPGQGLFFKNLLVLLQEPLNLQHFITQPSFFPTGLFFCFFPLQAQLESHCSLIFPLEIGRIPGVFLRGFSEVSRFPVAEIFSFRCLIGPVNNFFLTSLPLPVLSFPPCVPLVHVLSPPKDV